MITLSQIRQNRSEEKAQIGFTIYKDIPSGPLDREFARNAHNQAGDSGAFVNSRDVSSSFLLAAGSYCVVIMMMMMLMLMMMFMMIMTMMIVMMMMIIMMIMILI